MFDIWWGDIELTTLTLIISVVILLPIQLLLCFKVKSPTIRLLPIILFSLLAAAFIIMHLSTTGLGSVAYILLALFAGFMVLMCGIGWGIWAVVNRRKKKP